GAFEQPRRVPEMMTRSDFRDDATIGLMRGRLRRDLAGKQLAVAQDSESRFITRRLDRQKQCTHFAFVSQAGEEKTTRTSGQRIPRRALRSIPRSLFLDCIAF